MFFSRALDEKCSRNEMVEGFGAARPIPSNSVVIEISSRCVDWGIVLAPTLQSSGR